MVEATASFRLDPTSILLDVCKVFGTLIWCEWSYGLPMPIHCVTFAGAGGWILGILG